MVVSVFMTDNINLTIEKNAHSIIIAHSPSQNLLYTRLILSL